MAIRLASMYCMWNWPTRARMTSRLPTMDTPPLVALNLANRVNDCMRWADGRSRQVKRSCQRVVDDRGFDGEGGGQEIVQMQDGTQ